MLGNSGELLGGILRPYRCPKIKFSRIYHANVLAQSLEIHERPDSTSTVLGTKEAGTVVEVLNGPELRSGVDWVRVVVQAGWIPLTDSNNQETIK